MELDENRQKIIYEFLKATTESLNGFRSAENKEFIFNDALAYSKNKRPSSLEIESTSSGCTMNKVLSKMVPKQNLTKLETINHPTSKFLTDEDLWKLSQVQYDAENCKSCVLRNKRTKCVFGEGVFSFADKNEPKKRPDVLVIGEGPGHDEDVTGRPFVGRAGQLLDKMLIAINLSRLTNCYICNVVKCRPPNNRQPAPDEVKKCLPFLHKQIEILKPQIIMLMGRTACHALLDTSEGINRLHGCFFNLDGIPAMCTYHPSALLHNNALKRPAWEDLKLFRAKMLEI